MYHFLKKKMIIYFKKEATIRWGMISKILYVHQKTGVKQKI